MLELTLVLRGHKTVPTLLYRGMVCVESANAAENGVKVAAVATHSLHVSYSIEKVQ
jgi:hypothetical protein